MDGVIYHGNQILPGVPEFIQWLHDEKKEYLGANGKLNVEYLVLCQDLAQNKMRSSDN